MLIFFFFLFFFFSPVNEYYFLFIHTLKQFFMFVNYGDKVNQTKSHFKQQKKPRNFDFIGFSYLNYLTSVKITCLRNFGEYFFNWRRSGVLRLFFEVRYKRSPDSLCSSVIFTRMVSPFYYSAEAALAILRPL